MEGSAEPPVLDGYEYQENLGSGGFADVYRYKQRFPRRSVAVKVLRSTTMDRAARNQFIAEANTMAQLSNHPAIASIFSAGVTQDGRPYLVMEYCSRGSLGSVFRLNPLPVDQVLRIGVRIAAALESAHRLEIVHRDVKPANLLITDYGAAVLSDFGISVGDARLSEATVLQTERTSIGTLTGDSTTLGLSVPWAPPEAFDDEPTIDSRSDVYSLAATLFTLLEGRSPFERPGGTNGALHLSRRIERGELVPGERVDSLPELSSVLRRAMSVSPADRPHTALSFAEQLGAVERLLGHEPTPVELLGDGLPPERDVGTEPTALRAPGAIDDEDTRPRSPRNGAPSPPAPAEPTLHDAPQRRRRLPLLVSAGVLVVLLGGGAAIASTLDWNGAVESAPTAKPATARTPTPAPTPTPSATPSPSPSPISNVGLEGLRVCDEPAYVAAWEEFRGPWPFEPTPLTTLWEPAILDLGLVAVCGEETPDFNNSASQLLYFLGSRQELLALRDHLSNSNYSCREIWPEFGPEQGLDCADGAHHIWLEMAPLFGDKLDPRPLVSVNLGAFQWCVEGEYNCSTPEPW